MEGELTLPHSRYAAKQMHLAYRWSPDYYDNWGRT